VIETKVTTFIRNCWYVAAWASEIPEDGLFHRTLLNESVLIYRTSSGGLTAMENRCCHRGAPLHLGHREGDCVRCGYHGMRFDETGVCVEVPGQDRVPPKAVIRTYPVVEKDEFVWIWMGDPALADESKILSYWWHTDAAWRKKTATLHYNAPYTLIVDNLLDFSHLSYVHAGTIGTPSNATTRASVEPIEGGLKITRWYLNDQIQANRASIVTFTGAADRWQIYEWHAPSFLHLYTGSAPAGSGAPEGNFVPETMQYKHCSVQTPETDETTFYFFSHAANFKLDDPNVIDVVFGGVYNAFVEDKIIIEAQQVALKLGSPLQPIAIVHDAAMVKARALIDQLLEAEALKTNIGPAKRQPSTYPR
jgi:phenylpropionate dioxygenase-like ring-hydroxylating dioxygenase large terminal subunit